jgi:hypothetical protein
MTSRKDERDERAEEAGRTGRDAARTYWLSEQLGEQWRSEGDGVYRFVGSSSSPPGREGEEELRDAHAPLTRDPSEPADSRPSEHPRHHWRMPWRRH